MNTFGYVDQNPANWADTNGEFLNVIIGGGTSVLAGYVLAELTGQCYGWQDAGIDFAAGSAGVGLFSKIRQLYRLNKLRQIAQDAGMVEQAAQKGVEKYVGSQGARLEIKTGPGTLGFGTTWVKRAKLRVTNNGIYADPFSGVIGPDRSAAGHIPLEALPSEAAEMGALQGASDREATGGCGCE